MNTEQELLFNLALTAAPAPQEQGGGAALLRDSLGNDVSFMWEG